MSTPNKGHILLLHVSGDLFETQLKLPTPSGGFGTVTSPCFFVTCGVDGGGLILTGMAHKLVGPSDQTNGLSTPNKGHILLLHMSKALFRTQLKLSTLSGGFGTVTSPCRFTCGGDSHSFDWNCSHELGPLLDKTNGLSTPNKGHILLLHMSGALVIGSN